MTDPSPIRKRIRQVMERRKIDITVVWDDERALWLAEAQSLDGVGYAGVYGPTAEAPTVKEAILKLAEELEL
jgi:hypothetical protein